MADELARLAGWWADAFITYRCRVAQLGGMSLEDAQDVSVVARWEWIEDERRQVIAEGMRVVARIAHDFADTATR